MSRSAIGSISVILAMVAVIAFALVHIFWPHHRAHRSVTAPAPAMQGEPGSMLWAWEAPEDLTTLDPKRAGVSFLAREVFLGDTAQVRPRRQPLRVADGAWLMAVVRIETSPSFRATPALEAEAASDILAAASEPNVRGLQLDFDALASQRDFYAAVIRDVRRQLPASIPLSITALASWCGAGSWLRGLPSGALPIQEAVPMYFRMGGPAATRASASKDASTIAEPLCAGSMGLATDETWPAILPNQRVYVFRPGSWTSEDIAHVNTFGYQGLKGAPAQ